jgi:hypothetical protein
MFCKKLGKFSAILFLQKFFFASFSFLLSLFFLMILGFELRAYTLSHSTSPFLVMGFFEIGFHGVFVQAGFEPRSS